MADRHWAIHWARRNWFVPLLAILLAIEVAFARTTLWAQDGLAEAVILFDLCVFVPALHFFCYRRTLARRALLIRTAALSCGGIYIASLLVPVEAQRLIAELGWARIAGLALVAAFELWVVIATVKLVFGGAGTDEIAAKSGAPLWVARLMQAEARFWKFLWRLIRGR